MDSEQLRQLLSKYGLSPKHFLGQNFLINEDVLDKIVEAGGRLSGQAVLEIGPGLGSLTERLLTEGAEVLAIEKDENFKPRLRQIQKTTQSLKVEYGDVLKLNLTELLRKHFGLRPVSVIANIPYYITGKIIQQLLELVQVNNIVMLVQKEVAQNMAAPTGKLNLLGLSVQLKGQPQLEMVVSKKSFFPVPKIDSAIVSIKNIQHASDYDEKELFKVARALFAGKRKQIHNTLTNNLRLSEEVVKQVLKTAGVKSTARPQELNLLQWKKLSRAVSEFTQKD